MSEATAPPPRRRSLREVLTTPLPHMPLRADRFAVKTLMLAATARVETINEERLRDHRGPLILAANHLNNFEALATPAVLMSVRSGRMVSFLSDWMFRYYPIVGWLVRRGMTIPVWHKKARLPGMNILKRNAPTGDSLAGVERVLRAGGCVMFYPEAKRNRNPHELRRGHAGVARAALSTGAPILPVGIDFHGRPSASITPRFPRLIVRFGEPMSFEAARAELRRKETSAPVESHGRASTVARRRLERAVTQSVMQAIGNLSGKRPAPPKGPRPGELEVADQVPVVDVNPRGLVTAEKIVDTAQKADALSIVEEVYVREKGWMERTGLDDFPGGSSVSWFMVRCDGIPAGLLRLVYDPPLEFAPGYEVNLREGVDWMALAARARIVEVGRFMISERYRTRPRVVMRLMNAATREVVEKGYTHLLTDVFDGEANSPLQFHTRILGFERIGTHRRGEMKTAHTRIILALDIDQAYIRMKKRGGRTYREFTEGFRDLLEQRIGSARSAAAG